MRTVASEPPIYDRIGVGYASRRKPDARFFARILEALTGCETVLNIGAGTGSYEPPTCALAIEPSWTMIGQRPAGAARCVRAVAEHLPLRDRSFDASLAILTMHHWKDAKAGLAEMRRVTRKRIVLFTWDPGADREFWLTRDYFPAILEIDRRRFPSMRLLREALARVQVQAVPVPADCQDGLFGAFWQRPEAYLDPVIQRSNSAMAQMDPAQVRSGIDRLRRDLAAGTWSRRNSSLKSLSALDLGYRLIVSEPG